jgi:hypothetical protein
MNQKIANAQYQQKGDIRFIDLGVFEDTTDTGNEPQKYKTKISFYREVNKPIMAIFFNYFNILSYERTHNGNKELNGIVFRGILNADNSFCDEMPDSIPMVFNFTTIFSIGENEFTFVLSAYKEGGQIRNIIRITSLMIDDNTSTQLYDKIFKLALDCSNLKGSYLTIEDDTLEWQVRQLKDLSFDDVFLPEVLMGDLKTFTKLYETKGILQRYMFSGIPGTGKTESTRAISKALNKMGVTIIKTNICDIIKQKFELATILAPSIVILDDIDLYLGDRNHSGVSTLLGQFLDILDGVDKLPSNVGVIASTNAPHLIDLAAQRPGRFNKLLFFDELTEGNIKDVIVKSLSSMNKEFNNVSDADIELLTDKTLIDFFKKDGSTGAFIYEAIKNIKHTQDIQGNDLDLPKIIRELSINNKMMAKKLSESTIKSKLGDNNKSGIGFN